MKKENILPAEMTAQTVTRFNEPICRMHELPITACKFCYTTIFEEADHLSADARHQWAIRNIYV